MKVDDAIETITRFFNDLIGSLVPGTTLVAGLAVMHFGPTKIAAAVKSFDGAALALIVGGLTFAVGHALMAVFELVVEPLIRKLRVIVAFDRDSAKELESYSLFAEIVSKLRDPRPEVAPVVWDFHDLLNVAMSVSTDAAYLGRRFMFIALLCNGVGTTLLILLVDYWSCLAFSPKLLATYDVTMNWLAQSILITLTAVALFKRGETFYRRAMSTPFAVAVAELKLKRAADAVE